MTDLACSDVCGPHCVRRDTGEWHALPWRCIQDFARDAVVFQRCSFYMPIREWAERMPVGPGRWIRPINTPMGYAAPVAICSEDVSR